MGLFFKEDLDLGLTPKWGNIGCALVAFLIGAPVACTVYNAYTTPSRVINRVLSTDSVLQNYGSYFDRNASYQARLQQIKEQEGYLKDESQPDEKIRLRTELSAMRMSCREIATSYNNDSQRLDRGLFLSHKLPPELSLEACDA